MYREGVHEDSEHRESPNQDRAVVYQLPARNNATARHKGGQLWLVPVNRTSRNELRRGAVSSFAVTHVFFPELVEGGLLLRAQRLLEGAGLVGKLFKTVRPVA